MDLTRRAFVRNTTILAASAAAGLTAGVSVVNGIKAHGPVEIWGHFLSKRPIVITKCTLSSDERQDHFGICIVDTGGKGPGILDLSLSSMRQAIQNLFSWKLLSGQFTTSKQKQALDLYVRELHGKVMFALHDWDSPVWMSPKDVARVL